MPHLKTRFLPATAYRPGFLGKKTDLTQFALKVRLRWKYKFHCRFSFFLTYQGNLTYTQKMTHALISLHFLNGFHTSSVHYAPGPRTFFCRGHFRLATSGRRPPAAAATAMNEATRCKCNLEKPSCISFTLCSFSLLQYSKCYTSPVLFLWSLWGIVRSFVFQKPAASYWTPEIGCCLKEKNYQKFHIVLAFS